MANILTIHPDGTGTVVLDDRQPQTVRLIHGV